LLGGGGGVVCAGAGLVSYLFNYGSTSACNCRTMRARSSSPCLTCENSGRGAMPWCSSSYFRFIWPRGPMDKASAYGAGDCRFESCGVHCCRSDSDNPKILPPPMWTKFIMAQPEHHHVWILPSLPSKYAHALSHGLCGTDTLLQGPLARPSLPCKAKPPLQGPPSQGPLARPSCKAILQGPPSLARPSCKALLQGQPSRARPQLPCKALPRKALLQGHLARPSLPCKALLQGPLARPTLP
jgi:hypothetical protein